MKLKDILLLLLILIFSLNSNAQSTDPPNIILILADDLGYSDLGCYGGEIETPNLNSLADQGLRFTQFYNSARCWPTRSSILTGYYPQQVNMDGDRGEFPLWGHIIPHHLKQAGYRNYHSGKWHLTNVNKLIDGAGFNRSYLIKTANSHFAGEDHYLDDKRLPVEDENSGYYSTVDITDYAVKFLSEHDQKHSDSPFFLYLAYLAPHFPLHASQEDIDKYRNRYHEGWEVLKEERYNRQKELGFDFGENSPFEYFVTAPWSWPEKYLSDTIPGDLRMAKPWDYLSREEKDLHATKMAIHAAMVDRMDKEIGRVLEQLRKMGEEENTLILFLSDNGASAEQIVRGYGHDRNVPPGSHLNYLCLGPGFSTACNTPFRRHKHWTHEGGAATPLIAYWPAGINDRGGFRHSMSHIIDFLPTFCELAGVEPLMEKGNHHAPALPGKSLLSIFENDQEIHEELYFHHAGNKALRHGKWKAVISTPIDGRWQLYDMEEDRTELQNLADQFYTFGDPEWKKTMQNKLEEMKQRWNHLDSLYQVQGKVGLE